MIVNARINVPRIVEAMKAHGWGVVGTCVNCGVNNKTLAKVLRGDVPRRLDAFYRLCDGLNIPIKEALLGGTHKAEARPRLHVVSSGRLGNTVTAHD